MLRGDHLAQCFVVKPVVAGLIVTVNDSMREKIPQPERALAGYFAAHQRFMVAQQLAHIDYLGEAIERVRRRWRNG